MDTIEKRVRDRAYFLWLEEGRPHGRDQEHWERARAVFGLASGDSGGGLPPSMPERHNLPRAIAAAEPARAQAEHTMLARSPAQERSAKSPGKSGAAKKASDSNRKAKGKAAKP